MNNKGFAITTILYGTLILFMLLLVSMLGILSTYKDRLSILIDNTNGARDIINTSYNAGTEPEEVPDGSSYMVEFDSNGGSYVSFQNVSEGSKVTMPPNPTKSGYYFVEWQLNGVKYDFNSVVNKNMELVAIWAENVNSKNYSVIAEKLSLFLWNLKVYENNEVITVKQIKNSRGNIICSGTNTRVYSSAIDGESTLRLVLSDDTEVEASLIMD